MAVMEKPGTLERVPGPCPRGHHSRFRRASGRLFCRTCDSERHLRWRYERRGEEPPEPPVVPEPDPVVRFTLAEWVAAFPDAAASRLWIERGGVPGG